MYLYILKRKLLIFLLIAIFMEKNEMFSIVKNLEYDNEKIVYSDNKNSIIILRPSELSKHFNEYDKSKNFQIWLQCSDIKFRPNHLRVLIDLNLRARSRPDLKRDLFYAFDSIYYGKDPENVLNKLRYENFQFYLNDIIVIGILHQLFLIEQEYSYNRESHFDPPNLFLQGWAREFIDSKKEIDNMVMSVAHGQPPLNKYVSKENKKDKNYIKNLSELWYLL